jgi:quinohemoprotein ethanol dehydrogenase
MALNPKEGLIYIPAMISQQRFGAPANFTYLEGDMNVGIGGRPQAGQPPRRPAPSVGELVAWDPIARKARWRVDLPQWWRGGVLATAGGLVFQTAGEALQALDASTGKLLWSYATSASALAAACSYEIDGEQYIALMVGYGGGAFNSNDQPRHPGRLLVFKLGGTAKLPAFPTPVVRPRLDLTAAETARGDATRGTQLYGHFCGYCHSGGVFLPDLTRSPLILSAAGFKAVVLDGALKEQGMSPFRRFLNEADVEAIRAGLLERAKVAAPTPQAH